MTPKRAIEILKDEREGYRTYRPYMTHSSLDIMHALDRGVEALLAAEAKRLVDIDKVCEWLRARNVLTEESIKGFRKAMEE